MKRIVLFLGLLLLAIPARAQYLDGLPAVSAVAPTDIIPICQGGTAGHAGTCTTRKATASQIQVGGLFNTSLNLGSGTLTAANAILGGATFSGALHMGAFVIDGTNAQFTGGTLTGLTYAGGSLTGTFTGSPTLSGAPTFSGTPVFSTGASLTGTLSGSPTFSGAPTFSGTPVFSTGAAMSGTFSGAHTYSGSLTLSAASTALTVTNNASLGGTLTTGTGVTNGLLLSASTLSVTGTGNPVMTVKGLGTGGISFQTGATPFTGLQLTDGGASMVNLLRVTPGPTGAGVSIQAAGDAAAVLNLKAGTGGTAGSVHSFVPMNISGGVQYGAATTYTAGTAITGAVGTNPAMSWSNVTLSGTMNTGGGMPYFYQVTDHVAFPNSNYGMFYFSDAVGAGFDGGRITFATRLTKSAAAATLAMNNAYTGFFPAMVISTGDGGTSTTPLGNATNINPDATCDTGDWLAGCSNDEHDLRMKSGNSPRKINLGLQYGVGDAAHASGTIANPNSYTDAAIVINAAPTIGNGTGKGIVAIQLGQYDQDIPWDTTSSIGSAILAVRMNNRGNISQVGQLYIDDAITLPEVFARGKFIDNGSFNVDGLGNISSGNTSLTAISTGQSLSTSGVVEVSAVVVSGGTDAVVGSEIVDSINGIWEVATVSGAAVATVTLKRAGAAASCPVSPTATRLMGASVSPTLTITCANRIGLTVQNSSGTLGFYGATPIVKATPAGACAGNTGCQALRDALGNLGLINTGSISN